MKKVKASKLRVGNIVRDCDGCVFEVHDVIFIGNRVDVTYIANVPTHSPSNSYRKHHVGYSDDMSFEVFS